MTVSNRFTLFRAVFAPVFYLIFNLPVWLNSHTLGVISACIMIPLLAIAEITDYWDGHYARKYNEVSDFGKLFDPFADVVLNLTVFMCAVSAGCMPFVFFVLIFYREFSQTFLRMAALKKGFAIAAGEIRKLADESKQTITQITSFIKSIKESADSSCHLIDTGNNELDLLIKTNNELKAEFLNIKKMYSELLESLSDINTDVESQEIISSQLEDIMAAINEYSSNFTEITDNVINSVKKNSVED